MCIKSTHLLNSIHMHFRRRDVSLACESREFLDICSANCTADTWESYRSCGWKSELRCWVEQNSRGFRICEELDILSIYVCVHSSLNNCETHLAQSTPIGRPLIWSGHAPIVKLGDVWRFDCCWRLCWWSAEFGVTDDVIGEDVLDDVDEAFDSVCCCWPKLPPLIGDFSEESGEFIWLFMFKNSQFLQSISLRLDTSMCSGHARRCCCCCCCCCARNSFSVLCCSRRAVSWDKSADTLRNLFRSPPAKCWRTFSAGGAADGDDERPVSNDRDFGVNLGCCSRPSLSALSDCSNPSSLSVPSSWLLLLLLLSFISLTSLIKLFLLILILSSDDGIVTVLAVAASRGSRNDICGISSVFFCIIADEYSRHNNSFSDSLRFNLCSRFACDEKSFEWPKLNLQMKHIRIGFCCRWCWLFSFFSLKGDLSFVGCCESSDGVAHGDVSADWSVVLRSPPIEDWVDDEEFIVASRDEMTRNEWIFGLFDCETSAFGVDEGQSQFFFFFYSSPKWLILTLNTTTIRHLQWRLILGIDYVCFSVVIIHELPLKPFDFSIIWRGFIGIVFL